MSSARARMDAVYLAVSSPARGVVEAVTLDAELRETARERVPEEEFAGWARDREAQHPRWVWADTKRWYPALLAAGVRVGRGTDGRRARRGRRRAAPAAATGPARAGPARWAAPAPPTAPAASAALFELDEPEPDDDPVVELRRQRAAIASSAAPSPLALLTAADSVGALVAVELEFAGLPWDADRHDRILTELLGERTPGARPAHMERLVGEIRAALDDPRVNPDSPPALLRSLQRAGLRVGSTSRWELEELEHPVIAPLLAYKRLARLHSANGWAWLAEWVHEGRFRPVYVPAGVVTGRWASDGGGALQLPQQVRGAVVADPGWRLVVADAAQLEPRVLAAMASDEAMARAARGSDLYAGVVASGAVATREEAKYAVLGAMYGASTGDSGRLVLRLRKVYPRAMALVDAAARTGENGGVVSTRLGRSSPRPDDVWQAEQAVASGADAAPTDVKRSRQRARERGRFTRNFVVQGTAAEWSLIWLAEIRHRLRRLPDAETEAAASGPFSRAAHLAFFLHDEVILHVPQEHADAAAAAVRDAAAIATRRLFGDFPI